MKMRRIRLIPLLLAALLLFACGKTEQPAEKPASAGASEITFGADDVVLTVGDEPVYASVYRYHLNERFQTIRRYGLDDHEIYLSYVSNPAINYLYSYYDTRTDEGMQALAEDVLDELSLEKSGVSADRRGTDVFTAGGGQCGGEADRAADVGRRNL